ncbi:hypothetical protein TFKS16_0094 [Tannerella forsythia KS16]|nr:hypothetical protein TFKS16_0094 [Tannerella forsythia KS16]
MVISVFISFRKIATSNGFTQSKMVPLLLMCLQCNYEVSKTFTITKLAKHHSEELIPTGEGLDVFVALILGNNTIKLASIQEGCKLSEYILIFKHIIRYEKRLCSLPIQVRFLGFSLQLSKYQ